VPVLKHVQEFGRNLIAFHITHVLVSSMTAFLLCNETIAPVLKKKMVSY
jgi:hypothetical protein